MKNNDGLWIALIIAGVVIFNLWQQTNVSSTSTATPLAGAGTDPYDVSPYDVLGLAEAGGLV